MKKQLIVLFSCVLFVFASSSCQKFAGKPVTNYFSVDGTYTELQVEDAFDVIVSDTATLITITAGEYVMPKVVVENDENTLKIYLKGWHTNRGEDMTVIMPYNVDLTSVGLSGASEFHSEFGLKGEKVEVEISGASDFYCDIEADKVEINMSGSSNFYGNVKADEINMDLSGSSDIESELSADELDLNLSGASDATLKGEVDKLKIEMTGSSNIIRKMVGNRYALVCNQCEGVMSGASEAYIHCDGAIRVNLSGGSELHFTGNGNPADSSTSGGSDIIHDVNP